MDSKVESERNIIHRQIQVLEKYEKMKMGFCTDFHPAIVSERKKINKLKNELYDKLNKNDISAFFMFTK